jgi:hypothetical protein
MTAGKRIQTNIISPKCLRSVLYAWNPVSNVIQNRLDAMQKAQHVGKQMAFSVHKLDAFALHFIC